MAVRVNEVTLLLSSDVTYTSPSSGLTATASAPASCTPGAQPAITLLEMQPLPSVACVSAPVEGLRTSTSRAFAECRSDVHVVAVAADREALRFAQCEAGGAAVRAGVGDAAGGACGLGQRAT